MTKVKLTFKEVIEKINALNQIDGSIDDKLSYGLKKLGKRLADCYTEVTTELQEKISDIEIEYACTNEDGSLRYDVVKSGESEKEIKRFLVYTPKGTINKNKAVRDLYKETDKKIVEIEPYIATITDISSKRLLSLNTIVIEELDGLLFNKSEVEKLKEKTKEKE